MTTPPGNAPHDTVPPLTDQQVAYLRRVALARRPGRNTAATATTSAVTILFIAAFALLFSAAALSLTGVAVCLAIGAVGLFEWLGAQRVRRADPAAAGYLGRNQLVFLGVITAYCVWQSVTFSTDALRAQLTQGDTGMAFAELGVSVDQLLTILPLLVYGFYGLIVFLSLLFQGGLALYYFTRRRPIERYLSRYPDWARAVVDPA